MDVLHVLATYPFESALVALVIFLGPVLMATGRRR